MTVTDPLAGLGMPPGTPDGLSAALSSLAQLEQSVGTGGARAVSAVSNVVGSDWVSANADRTKGHVAALNKATTVIADAARDAGRIVQTCQSRWQEAINMGNRARSAIDQATADETAHQNAGAQACQSLGLHGRAADPAGFQRAAAAADGSDGYQSPLRASAASLGQQAAEQANQAIQTAIEQLSAVQAAVGLLGNDQSFQAASQALAALTAAQPPPYNRGHGYCLPCRRHTVRKTRSARAGTYLRLAK